MNPEYLPPVKRQAPQMPAMPPQISANLPSAYVTPIDMEAGLWDRLWEKKRIKDVSEMVSYQRKASDDMLVIAENTAKSMKTIMTFGAEVEMVFVRHGHEKAMFSIEERKGEADIVYREKEISVLEFQAQSIQLDNNIKFWNGKEAEISYNTSQLNYEAQKRAMEC